jgi:hypothetical protein
MGIPIAQAAQPISQQQPAPQGKGSAAMAPGTYDPAASMNGIRSQLEPSQNAAISQIDSTVGGVPNQPGHGQTLSQTLGKGGQPTQPQQQPQQQFGKGGTTNSATSGQPRMGRSNPYPNTIQPWDNSNNQTQTQSGKGKGH